MLCPSVSKVLSSVEVFALFVGNSFHGAICCFESTLVTSPMSKQSNTLLLLFLLSFVLFPQEKHERDSGSLRLFGIPSSS